ncbi:MAG: helix-turn-helix transcriptional regulator [Candidatus Babeliales bacterium]
MKRKKGFYSISVVAKMFDVHQQTVRMYEKEGLISPSRSSGNTRLFSEEDVDRLEEVINLTHKMGVNLAGVEIILKLQKKIKRMQDEINKTFTELSEESDVFTREAKKQAERLGQIKRENIGKGKGMSIDIKAFTHEDEPTSQGKATKGKKEEQQDEKSGWEIEYNDD